MAKSPNIISDHTGEEGLISAITGILPGDIVATQILPRLPVKSLFKFRCVSKSWNAFISSNNKALIKSHLQHSTNNNTAHAILASFWTPGPFNHSKRSYFLQCSLTSWFHHNPPTLSVPDFTFIKNEFSMQEQDMKTVLVGVINGLCCVQKDGKDFFFWNPATRTSHKLPEAPGPGVFKRAWFGFVEATNDYKVLAGTSLVLPDTYRHVFSTFPHDSPVLYLYSSRTNSWKPVENKFMNNCRFAGSAKYLNGRLHWSTLQGDSSRWDISYFDLETEEHGLVELPESWGRLRLRFYSVGVLEGCLACVCGDPAAAVWIMKQYGLRKSWQRVTNCYGIGRALDNAPFCLAPGGEIMFTIGSSNGFMIYENHGMQRYLKWDDAYYFQAHIYVESLVSPVPELQ